MSIIDQILNAAGLLLWLNWRSIRVATTGRTNPLSLVSNLKSTEPRRVIRNLYLLALVILLVVRGFFYWNIGSAAGWIPLLDLGPVTLPFRSDHPYRIFLFSLLSFGLWIGTFYSWVLLISVANAGLPDTNHHQRLVRTHLGLLERLPPVVRLLLPGLIVLGLWVLGRPLLTGLGIVPPPVSRLRPWGEGLLMLASTYLAWKVFLVALFSLHLVNSYVYLGDFVLLQYASATASNLLRVLAWIPHRFGRVDILPFLGLTTVVLIDRLATIWLPRLYTRLPL